MAYVEFPNFKVTQVLPILMLLSFIITYFEVIEKLIFWLKVKEYYAQEYTKEGLQKSVLEFVSTFHKLSEELLKHHEAKENENMAVDNYEPEAITHPMTVEIELTKQG